jgi:hypothetical protein
MYAQQRTGTEGTSNAPGTFVHPEPYTLHSILKFFQVDRTGI